MSNLNIIRASLLSVLRARGNQSSLEVKKQLTRRGVSLTPYEWQRVKRELVRDGVICAAGEKRNHRVWLTT